MVEEGKRLGALFYSPQLSQFLYSFKVIPCRSEKMDPELVLSFAVFQGPFSMFLLCTNAVEVCKEERYLNMSLGR